MCISSCGQWNQKYLTKLKFQAEARDKERQKEETRKQRKLENGFKNVLREFDVDYKTEWEEIRPKIEKQDAFKAIIAESERIRVFKVGLFDSIRLQVLCGSIVSDAC